MRIFYNRILVAVLLFSVYSSNLFSQAEIINTVGTYWRLRGNSNTDTATHFLGTLDAAYMSIRTNNVRRMTFDTSGRVGIGTTTPRGSLEVVGVADTNLVLSVTNYGKPNELWFKRAQGSIGAPTILGTSGSIGRIDARGYDGSAYHNATRIEFLVDSTSGTGNMPGRIAFLTNPAFSTGAPNERMRINRNGLVGINTTAPAARLDINGDLAIRQTTLTLVNGSNDNVAISPFPAANSYYRITGPTGAFSITGLSAGADGRIVILQNATTQTLTVKDQTVSSVSNRIMTGGGDLIVGDSGTVTMIYSTTDNRWQVQSFTNGTLANTAGSTSWLLLGNSSTTAGTNFVGTTDAQDLVLKRFNVEGLRMTTGGALWATGSTGTGITPTSGASTRMMWIPAKAAFRAGVVTGAQWDDVSVGTNSVAFGNNNTASGAQSAAFGNNNTVSGQNSIAIGNGNTVTATHALVSGNGNNAAGNFSVVFNNTASSTAAATTSMAGGFQSQTQANLSVAVGWADTAKGVASVALGGFSNEAQADYSFSTGNNNLSSGTQAATFGSGNTASGSNSFATGNNNNVSGQNSLVTGNANTVTATHALVSGNGNNAAGNYSVVFNNTASSTAAATTSMAGGFQSQTQANLGIAIGWADTTSGVAAVTLGGFSNIASASNSFATGNNNNATAAQAAAFGQNNAASGNAAMVSGDGNTVSGFNSFATGNSNTVSSTRSMVSGISNNVAGENNIVSGVQNQIVTPYGHSIVVGYQDTLSASSSAVFGFLNKVTAFTGFAMGDRNNVTGQTASAFGYQNVASGTNSFVTGQQDTTIGNVSSAFGTGNRAASFNEMVVGMYATQYTATSTSAHNTADRIFNVGIGTGSGTRADAFTVLKGGNVRVAGLATGGSFITAPTATTDKIMFADANGDLRAFANGSSGQTLTINGSGVPAWTSAAASTAWDLLGNAGTSAANNFVGTTDNVPLSFRVNNVWAGRIDPPNGNVFYGSKAGIVSTGIQNTFVGDSAGLSNTTGVYNTMLGKAAGQQNVSGSFNVMVGVDAGFSNNASNNIFIGRLAGSSNTTGTNNTYVGNLSGNVGNGSNNTFLGGGSGATAGASTFVTLLGAGSNATGTFTNATAVGANATIDQSNTVILGSGADVGVGTTTPARKMHISGATSGIRYGGVATGGSFITTPSATTDKIMFADANGDLRALAASGTNGYVLTSTASGPAWNAAASIANEWHITGNTGTTASTAGIGSTVNNNFIGTTDAKDFVLATNGLEKLRISSARHMIGINQTDPQFALDMTINPDAVYPCTYNGIRINNPTYSNACTNGMFLGFDNGQLMGTSAALWNFLSTGHIKFGLGAVGTAEKMRLTSNGLGINVTSPTTQLHITENTGLRNGMMVSQPTSPNNDGALFGLDISSPNGGEAMMWNYIANADMKFGTQNTERMRITSTGSVGIATTLPQRILHVAGNSNTERIDGVSSLGAFSTAPTSSTDRLLYADANGDVKAIPAGSNGDVLTLNGSGVPGWASSGGNNWSITGNSGTVDGTNFIGTTDNVPFNVRVNNRPAGRVDNYNQNACWGYEAGSSGWATVAIGDSALYANVAYANIGVGFAALRSNITGIENVAVGLGALRKNTTGSNNVGVGTEVLNKNTTGSGNTGLGTSALYQSNGSYNTSVGYNSLNSNTTGEYNSALGSFALSGNTSGTGNVAVGYAALSIGNNGYSNVAVGNNALHEGNNLGFNNVAVGDSAGFRLSLANGVTAIGSKALLKSLGGKNTTVGAESMFNSLIASNNAALGYQALYSNITGGNNSAVGHEALYNSTASSNTGTGYHSLYGTTTGYSNTAVGSFAGNTNTTGTRNTLVGDSADVVSVSLTNATAIGWNSRVSQNHSMVLGSVAGVNGATNHVKVAIGATAPNTRLDVNGDLALRERVIALTSGTVNNQAVDTTTFIAFTSTGNNTITGFAGGVDGKMITVFNSSSNTLTLVPNNAGSLVANQIVTGAGTLILADTGVATLQYSAAKSKWVVTSYSNGNLSAGNSWYTTGNSGTSSVTNFLGTTDNVALVFKTNNQTSGKIDPINSNSFFGYWAGRDISTGTQNVAVGTNALLLNTVSAQNTAIGTSSLENTNGGAGNTAVGYTSLQSNTTGTNNSAIGLGASGLSSIGSGNTAIGYYAMLNNRAGSNATAVGNGAMLYANSQLGAFTNTNVAVGYEAVRGSVVPASNTADNNTGVGYQALRSFSSGGHNTAMGTYSLFNTTLGSSNSAFGVQTLYNNTTGSSNVAMGWMALNGNTTASNNTAIGFQALASNVTGGNATAIGYRAMYNANNTVAAFTSYNVAVGYFALMGSATPANNTGNYNTALGYEALMNNSSGTGNYASGYHALASNTTGGSNSGSGYGSLGNNTTGSYNTATGSFALTANTNGNSNTAVGYSALISTTQGFSNTALGENSGNTNTLGFRNTLLGDSSDVSATNLTNATAIGWNSRVGQSNSMVLGSINGVNGATSDVAVAIGTTTPAHALDVRRTSTVATINVQTATSGNAYLSASAPSGNEGAAKFNTNGIQRWMLGKAVTAEAGANVGSDFFINRYNDVGAYLDQPFFIKRSTGNIGVLTANPTQAKVVINGNASSGIGTFGFLNSTGGTGTSSTTPNNYSLYCSDRVAASEFNAFSDARIKNILSRSNGENDLAAINKVQVTDYQYIDKVQKGSGAKKGFIAQEVEKIIPEAVSHMTDFVPDIYSLSTAVSKGTYAGSLVISVVAKHNLKEGDMVRLITDKQQEVFVEKVISENSFEVCGFEGEVEKVFVFGKQVTDFRTVDYDRIFVTGVSAIQELARQNEEMRKTISSQQLRIQQNENDVQQLKASMSNVMEQLNIQSKK